jgi:hypothetical protein
MGGAAMKPDIEAIRKRADEVVQIKETFLFAQKAGELIDPHLFDLLAYVDSLEAVAEAARKYCQKANNDCVCCEASYLYDALQRLDGDGQ